MNPTTLVNKIKYSAIFYSIYYYIGTLFVNVMKLFLRSDEKLVLFVSYGGKCYDDSPRVIFESMITDLRFKEYKFVWAFLYPEKYDIPSAEVISINSFKYLKTALKARIWITNVSMTRGLNFSGKKTFLLNTWHGSPMKIIGKDAKERNTFSPKGDSSIADILLAQSDYDMEVFSNGFNIPINKIACIGYPRNDRLIEDNTVDKITKIKQKLNLPIDKKILLYAPTYREYIKDENNNCILSVPFDLNKWQQLLDKDYFLIIKGHSEVRSSFNKNNSFVIDLSGYTNLNDLLLVSDILISDYSSIMIDYSILRRPILCYIYDYDKYASERGFIFDIRNHLSYETDEDSLLRHIVTVDTEKELEKVDKFQKKFVQECGHATAKTLNIIFENINN